MLLSAGGCSAKLKHVETDPSFKRESVASDGLAILGCVSLRGGDDLTRSTALGTKLADELRDARENVRIFPWGSVRAVAGDSLLQTCFASMRDYGSLKRAELDSLAASMRTQARYAVIHRIIVDDIGTTESDNWDGNVHVSVDVTTRHDVSVEFVVYDLELGKSVWSGTIDGMKQATRKVPVPNEEDEKEEKKNSGGVLHTLGSLLGLGDDDDKKNEQPTSLPAPDPPTLESIMGSIYSEFADKLLKDE
jgi:hypothetical protein